MSKTIAINAGSSSLKWQLYQMPEETVVAKGIVERIGLKDSIFTIKYGEDQKFEQIIDINDHEVAVKMLLDQLIELNILASLHGKKYQKTATLMISGKIFLKAVIPIKFAGLCNGANSANAWMRSITSSVITTESGKSSPP